MQYGHFLITDLQSVKWQTRSSLMTALVTPTGVSVRQLRSPLGPFTFLFAIAMFSIGFSATLFARGILPFSSAHEERSIVAMQPLSPVVFRPRPGVQTAPPVVSPEFPPHAAPDIGPTIATGSVTDRALMRRAERMREHGGSLESAQPAPAPSAPVLPSQIGVYLTQSSVGRQDFLLDTLDSLRVLTGASIVFDVKGGKVFFPSQAELATKLGLIAPAYDLQEVLRIAHERKIYTIGRFIAVKDPNLADALPEAQIRHPESQRSVGDVWVDPANATVLAYNGELIAELAKSGIDEINLDYIRYPTEYAQADIGLHGAAKSDHLEQFISMARRIIDEEGGRTKLGISSYAILGWNYPVNLEAIGQDVVRFAPMLDVISPMAYPATFSQDAYYDPVRDHGSRMYHLVYRTLTGYRDLLGDQAWKLRPWIQGYGITTKNLKDEIQAVFDSGSCGFQLWNASNSYGLFFGMLKDVRRPLECGM